MVSAFLRIALMVTGMDMHLQEEGNNYQPCTNPCITTQLEGISISPLDHFGNEFISAD